MEKIVLTSCVLCVHSCTEIDNQQFFSNKLTCRCFTFLNEWLSGFSQYLYSTISYVLRFLCWFSLLFVVLIDISRLIYSQNLIDFQYDFTNRSWKGFFPLKWHNTERLFPCAGLYEVFCFLNNVDLLYSTSAGLLHMLGVNMWHLWWVFSVWGRNLKLSVTGVRSSSTSCFADMWITSNHYVLPLWALGFPTMNVSFSLWCFLSRATDCISFSSVSVSDGMQTSVKCWPQTLYSNLELAPLIKMFEWT